MPDRVELGGREQIGRHRHERDRHHDPVQSLLPVMRNRVVVGRDAAQADPDQRTVRQGGQRRQRIHVACVVRVGPMMRRRLPARQSGPGAGVADSVKNCAPSSAVPRTVVPPFLPGYEPGVRDGLAQRRGRPRSNDFGDLELLEHGPVGERAPGSGVRSDWSRVRAAGCASSAPAYARRTDAGSPRGTRLARSPASGRTHRRRTGRRARAGCVSGPAATRRLRHR